ncbi:MAG: phosphonate ABC transporter ATP-binding protein [Deltaproteobacteria bacterium]|nr:phosphonate ABC transporter ATP-binding protein [Deltaproteobacteria bacterium]
MFQIEALNLALGYGKRVILPNANFQIGRGEFISIIGPSGAGKSTLLMSLNAGVNIFRGELHVLGEPVHRIGNFSLKELRARIGIIFQGFNLVKRLTVVDNIASGMLGRMYLLPTMIKYYTSQQYDKIWEYMRIVGIEDAALQRCDRLSGGQMQRVAIARAMAQEPEIILADEPISSLDPVSARRVMDTLKAVNEKYGITIISNLHQLDYAQDYCTRILGIHGGEIVFDGAPAALTDDVVRQIYNSSGETANDEPNERGFICRPFAPEAAVNA